MEYSKSPLACQEENGRISKKFRVRRVCNSNPFLRPETKIACCTGAQEHAAGEIEIFSPEFKDAGQKQVDKTASLRYLFRLIHKVVVAHSNS